MFLNSDSLKIYKNSLNTSMKTFEQAGEGLGDNSSSMHRLLVGAVL